MEYVPQVAWSVGPFQFKEIEDCVTSLKFVTNRGATYGPFGRGAGAHHSLPVLDAGSVVGMFCRADDYLHSLEWRTTGGAAAYGWRRGSALPI